MLKTTTNATTASNLPSGKPEVLSLAGGGFPRPLLHTAVVQAACNLNEDQVQAAIEDGALEFVFDLRTPQANRAYPRIFSGSLQNYLAQKKGEAGRKYEFSAVVQEILAVNLASLKVAYLAYRFCIGSDHMHALLAARCFSITKRPAARHGRSSSPEISRASVVSFLEERRMC